MSSHQDSGRCEWCKKIFDRYPEFHPKLRAWFEQVQLLHPEAHISCAGRGRMDQEADFHKKVSNAHFGQSSHNYNAAIDVFKNAKTITEMYDKVWFRSVIGASLEAELNWYGLPGSKYYELPHIELKGWQGLAHLGELRLVE